MRRKVVAVTGSSGFIGSHLVDELKKENPRNIVLIDLKEGKDLTNISQMNSCLSNVDVVFDLATLPLPLSLRQPSFVAYNIYKMCLTLCQLCKQGVFKTLIHVSSSEAYGSARYTPQDETHPLEVRTPYAAAKASADLLIRSYYHTFGIDCAIARPFNNYGPRQPIELGGLIPATINRILHRQRPVIYGDGNQRRDFIYVKDTVRGIIDIYKSPNTRGQVINLAGGNPTSIADIVALISKLMRYKGAPVYQAERVADVHLHHADIGKAKNFINFKPHTSLEEGLKKTIAWYSRKL